MTTGAEITAAIAEASSVAVTPAQMVIMLDRALAAAVAVAGTAEVSAVTYTVAGRSRTLAIAEFRSLREYYARITGGSGGMIFAGVEFGR